MSNEANLIQVLELDEKDGQVKLTCLGPDLGDNQQVQYTVPPNVWFGAFPTKDFHISTDGGMTKTESRDAESHYSLVGCTCAPAFQFLIERKGLMSTSNLEIRLLILLVSLLIIYQCIKCCFPVQRDY